MAGMLPLPAGWLRSLRDVARSQDLNRADREATAGGYYEGLIGGAGANSRGVPSALEVALIGKPIDRNRDLVRRIMHERDDDFLQFELKPNADDVFFGARFTTNAAGMRDGEYALVKPAGVFRVVLLGSSIDMGWGVATPDTYENRLETWLNAEAQRRGLARRFEVLNFSVAAYGPAQRYDLFRRRALPYAPDLVLLSSTLLDPRLTEIHLGGLIKNRVDLKFDFFRGAVAAAGIDPERERSSTWEQLDRRQGYKARVKQHYWTFADATVATFAADCRSLDIPLATLLVPRACRDDDPDARALAVARHSAIGERHAVPLLDLAATFDGIPPHQVEVAPGDDHPNQLGHRLLFEQLARSPGRPSDAGPGPLRLGRAVPVRDRGTGLPVLALPPGCAAGPSRLAPLILASPAQIPGRRAASMARARSSGRCEPIRRREPSRRRRRTPRSPRAL